MARQKTKKLRVLSIKFADDDTPESKARLSDAIRTLLRDGSGGGDSHPNTRDDDEGAKKNTVLD